MPFLPERTKAELDASLEAKLEKRQQQQLVANLITQKRIIKCKALGDLESAHSRLGYQSESVVCSQDIYLHTLALLEYLGKLRPETIVAEIHALHADLGDYLLYTRLELEEFAEGNQARIDLQESLSHHNNETMWSAADLESVIDCALLTQEYMLECVNKPQNILEVLGRLHYCRHCQQIAQEVDIERGRSMDNPYEDSQLRSELSQFALADKLAIRENLPTKGIDYCQRAGAHLQVAPLSVDFRQLLTDNNETLYKAWLKLRDRQNNNAS